MNIKRMDLQFFMSDDFLLEDLIEEPSHSGFYREITPLLNRNGVFKRGPDCWFEVDGRAFTYDGAQFDYELSLLDAPSLSMRQVEALRLVVAHKLASSQQKKMYNMFLCKQENLALRLSIYSSNKKFDYL